MALHDMTASVSPGGDTISASASTHGDTSGGHLAPLMPATRRQPRHLRSVALPLATALLALAIFVIDTVTKYEIAAATFYVVVVLMSLRFCRTQGVVTVSVLCILLTILSFVLTPDGNFRSGIANTAISLTAIAATTYLAIRSETARVTAERVQAHLAHVARITTLGEMAASIAHEVNQPLAAIVNNANACRRWMRAEPDNAEKIGASIDNIVDDANRASAIVNRVRALATRAESKRFRIEINHVVQDVLALMHVRLHESRIAVRTDLADGLPLIFGDGIQLQQVVLNLVANAMDAINTATAGEREIHIQSSKSNTRDVTIRIADTGIGLDPEVTSHLFEAFYSTKPHGMGMGLSICRSIIEAHGGYIGAEPNEPHGSTFYFTLPGGKESMP